MKSILPLLLVTASASAGKPLENAKAYVASIYSQVPGDFDYRSVRYAPELASLIHRDDSCGERGGGICVIEAVPFCECQDTAENYAVIGVRSKAFGINRAVVTVLLRNGPVQRFRVDLIKHGRRWIVADVHSPSTPSLVAFLRREVPRAEASQRDPSPKY